MGTFTKPNIQTLVGHFQSASHQIDLAYERNATNRTIAGNCSLQRNAECVWPPADPWRCRTRCLTLGARRRGFSDFAICVVSTRATYLRISRNNKPLSSKKNPHCLIYCSLRIPNTESLNAPLWPCLCFHCCDVACSRRACCAPVRSSALGPSKSLRR